MEPAAAPSRVLQTFSPASGRISEQIQAFKTELTKALKEYIRLSMAGDVKEGTYRIRELGSVQNAHDRLLEMTARGESLGDEAMALPLFRFLRELTCPLPRLVVNLSQNHFLAPLFPFPIDPESRWKIEGFLSKGRRYYVAHETLNTLVGWCVQGNVTAEIVELFPPSDVFLRFSDEQSGYDMDVQISLASLALITTRSLFEIRKLFSTQERLAEAFGYCSIHDYTLEPGVRSIREPLEIFCQSRPDILRQLEHAFFDQYLVETLSFIMTRLNYNAALKRGNMPNFIQDLCHAIEKRGGIYQFEVERLSTPEHVPSQATQLAIVRALTRPLIQQGLSPHEYSVYVQQKEWENPQKLEISDQRVDQIAPSAVTHLQQQLDRSIFKTSPEDRLVTRMRDYLRFILPVSPVGQRRFYAPDAVRARGLQNLIMPLINQLREPHPAIQEYLSLNPPVTLSVDEAKRIFPDAASSMQISTYQELLGHGCYVEASVFALFCKVCLGQNDASALLPVYDLDPMLQLFRIKANSGIEMQHVTCFTLYMLTRTKDRPCAASLFQDSAIMEQRLRLLAIPFYLPHMRKWFTPAKAVLAKADSIKLPPEAKKRLLLLVEGLKQSKTDEAFQKLPALEEGSIVPYEEGKMLDALASQSNISFDVYLSTVMMQPASKEGLINVGNSCWINASLQALKRILLQHPAVYENHLQPEKQKFKETLLDVLTHLNLQIAPLTREKLESLRLQLYQSQLHPEFNLKGAATELQKAKTLNQMHDPAIFIAALLDLFQITISTLQTLSEDGKSSETRQEQVTVLSLPLGARSLQEALSEYFDSNVGRKKKSIRVEEAPDMLIVQVLRLDNKSRYLEEALPHPAEALLEMSPYMVNNQKAQYRLASCIQHHRNPVPHYTAFVRDKESWGHYDDSNPCQEIKSADVKADKAYVLVFEKV